MAAALERPMSRRCARLVCLVLLAGMPAGRAADGQTQRRSGAEERASGDEKPPRRLRVDVEKHVEKVLEEEAKRGIPRFETSVEVVAKSPQVLLERFFGGLDLECGAVPGGAPSETEMRAYRHTPAPYIDLMALARALVKRFKGKGEQRYFLYRAVDKEGRVSFSLREGRLADAAFYNTPGTTFELVETFSDIDNATQAWRRLERGFPTAVATNSGWLPAPWVEAPCRPRR
jgi:hypothetical protein